MLTALLALILTVNPMAALVTIAPILTDPVNDARQWSRVYQVLTDIREYRLFCNIDYEGCARLPKCFTVDEREWGDQA